MWDEIWAEEIASGNVKGTLSKKDDKGVTRTMVLETGVSGDVTDESNWTDLKTVGKMTEKGKTKAGVNAGNSTTKEMSVKQTGKAIVALFSIKPKTKAKKPKEEGTVSEEDTKLENAAS